MFGSLVRWFGRGVGSGRSGRGAGSAPRFTPQLEALETRALPGGCPGGVLSGVVGAALLGARLGISTGSSALSGGTEVTPFGTRIGTVGTGDGNIALSGGSHVVLFGMSSKLVGVGHGTAFGHTVQVSRSTGEEIPQT